MNKEFTTEFIMTYRDHPALWKIRPSDYCNKNLKNEGYKALIEVCKKYNMNNITRDVVSKRIQSMRGCFRKEFKKIQNSKRSGSGSDDIYVPTLWYFDLLMFTVDQETPTDSIDNISQANLDENSETIDEEIYSPCSETGGESLLVDSEKEISENATCSRKNQETSSCASSVSSAFISDARKVRKRKNVGTTGEQREFLNACTKALGESTQLENESDAFGIYVGQKLKKVKNDLQKAYAESLITQILQKAQLNQLSENSNINTGSSSFQQVHYLSAPHPSNDYYSHSTPSTSIEPDRNLRSFYTDFDANESAP